MKLGASFRDKIVYNTIQLEQPPAAHSEACTRASSFFGSCWQSSVFRVRRNLNGNLYLPLMQGCTGANESSPATCPIAAASVQSPDLVIKNRHLGLVVVFCAGLGNFRGRLVELCLAEFND